MGVFKERTINSSNKKLKKILYILFYLFIFAIVVVSFAVLYFIAKLPDYKILQDYKYPVMTRLYSADEKFLKEYAREKRIFIPIDLIPNKVKSAFIAAEDDTFYKNSGISIKGIISAGFESIVSIITGKGRIRGASTITQQVAKNFLLSNERTMTRKIKEALLAIRLTNTFSKDELLELYLNQIFFGNRSYGIGMAALNYFDKSVDELTIEEYALLASLPKAPSQLDPTRGETSRNNVLERRNWIIGRMKTLGYITDDEAKQAIDTPINIKQKDVEFMANGEFYSEEVRKQLQKLYGNNGVLEDGNFVQTNIDPRLQELADKYLKKGIEEYDIRHGFRGAITNLAGEIDFENRWGDLINEYKIEQRYPSDWEKAVVLSINVENQSILIGIKKTLQSDEYDLENNDYIKISSDDNLLIMGFIPLKNLTWARNYVDVDTLGKQIEKIEDVNLKTGDVIVVKKDENKNEYHLKQIPLVNGGLVAMDPHTGKILAMMGGYIDSQMDFNRVTQAERQPGSTIKPFAYLSALENGFMPSSIIIDAEVTLDQGLGVPPYSPRNNEGEGVFYGPTTLRVGLEKSRNVTTVRLASEVGIKKVANLVKRFGISTRPRAVYSLVLGSIETNLLKMARAYSMVANGGKFIYPTLIEKIQDKNGITIFKRDDRECLDCSVKKDINFDDIVIPNLVDNRKDIIDSASAYQLTNMLVGVVQRGTGWRAKSIGKPIAGKTGTTNDGKDAWFMGYSPDLVVGVYVGFDKPDILGKNEFGSNVAGPIFTNFMKDALQNSPSKPFPVPDSVKLLKIDEKTGYYPSHTTKQSDIVSEAFKLDEEPKQFTEQQTDSIMDEFDNLEFQMSPEIIITDENIHRSNEEEVEYMENSSYEIEYSDDIINESILNKNNNTRIYNLRSD
ncbi:MAG: PBP1A family penicillin-binding protein [Rickettsiales bacterium]|jgi:penicillin-binding protein 1A|nr:PBP1A family penicillin-binding protein [Rickettsiales bacterium]